MHGIFLFLHLLLQSLSPNPTRKIIIDGTAQGSTYHIIYYAKDSIVRKRQIDSLLDRIDSSLSLYRPNSLINQFNRSTTGIAVDAHFRKVINKAMDTYRQTKGLFDISIYPITAAWGFGPRPVSGDPDSTEIQAILPCVDSRLLYWQGNMLRKKKPCVQLDANGIAQGYSVDLLASLLERYGIRQYLVELGGEIRAKGRKPDSQEKMSIGIESPGDDPDFSPIDRVIWLDKGAITTSGNYRRYHESHGRRISHLMDPHTGYPIQNELISVTLYAPDAITADAYDNALMGMGLRKALAFVERRPELAAHFIYHRPDGSVADTMSRRFRRFLKP